MPKEYIEREGLLNEIEEIRPINWTDTEVEITEQNNFERFENLVKSQPNADVQEVVRCGLCKHYKLRGGSKWCVLHMIWMHSHDYCSYGAKMDKE